MFLLVVELSIPFTTGFKIFKQGGHHKLRELTWQTGQKSSSAELIVQNRFWEGMTLSNLYCCFYLCF